MVIFVFLGSIKVEHWFSKVLRKNVFYIYNGAIVFNGGPP